jgi:hypothetical protein
MWWFSEGLFEVVNLNVLLQSIPLLLIQRNAFSIASDLQHPPKCFPLLQKEAQYLSSNSSRSDIQEVILRGSAAHARLKQ